MNNAEKELSEKPWTHPTKKVTDAQMLKIYAKTLNEVVEKMEIYEKAIKLMMIQCGLPDAGDACRAVIKTGKETLEDKE